jgi:hypothetical protein
LTIQEILERLASHNACQEGVDYVSSCADEAQVVRDCPSEDWLIFLAKATGKLTVEKCTAFFLLLDCPRQAEQFDAYPLDRLCRMALQRTTRQDKRAILERHFWG